ncbi:MAG: thiamine phosphate synthase [Rhodothermales bacterium]|nr:thiamine phosphate synthase [Rhodothermales bacterium]
MYNLQIGRLHILTDYRFQQHWPHWRIAEMAMEGGASLIQFREKHGLLQHIVHEARLAVARCHASGVPMIVNDRVDVALAIEADGVHLGQDDLPVHIARRILGDDAIVGGTATTVEQARRAEAEGATYVGFGPVYSTQSKANPASVKGLTGLEAVCSAISIPVIAIAGITADRTAEVIGAGAYGVAVMTAVSLAPDPLAATAELAEALRRSVDA